MLSPLLLVLTAHLALLHHPRPWPQQVQPPQPLRSPIPPDTEAAFLPPDGPLASGGLPSRRQPMVRMATTVAAKKQAPTINLLAADAVAQPLGAQKRLRALADKLTSLPPSSTVDDLDALLSGEMLQAHNFTSLLLAIKKRQKWRQASLVADWAERPDCFIELSTKHHNLLLSACARRQPKKALSMLRRLLERGVQTNAVTHNIAMTAALELGGAADALSLFEEMQHLGLAPTTISYNTAIHACAFNADAERALDLFREMKAVGVERSTVTYTGLIRACSEGGQLDKAMALFTYMEVAGVERNPVTYCVAINACTRNGQWELGLQLLHEMARKGIRCVHAHAHTHTQRPTTHNDPRHTHTWRTLPFAHRMARLHPPPPPPPPPPPCHGRACAPPVTRFVAPFSQAGHPSLQRGHLRVRKGPRLRDCSQAPCPDACDGMRADCGHLRGGHLGV